MLHGAAQAIGMRSAKPGTGINDCVKQAGLPSLGEPRLTLQRPKRLRIKLATAAAEQLAGAKRH